MKEHPVLFSAPMVRAILDGRKTQTRRVLTKQPPAYVTDVIQCGREFVSAYPNRKAIKPFEFSTRCPFGAAGDRLWVREAHALVPSTAYAQSDGVQQTMHYADPWLAAIYREGWERSHGGLRWRPSIHMPRWASRITLEVVCIRVERLHAISEQDARAEGFAGGHDSIPDYPFSATPREHFEKCSLFAKQWDANPWVWVIEFKRADSAQVAA